MQTTMFCVPAGSFVEIGGDSLLAEVVKVAVERVSGFTSLLVELQRFLPHHAGLFVLAESEMGVAEGTECGDRAGGMLAALDQRIGLRYAIPAMTGEDTTGSPAPPPRPGRPIGHPVSGDATVLIHQTSRGLSARSTTPRSKH